MNTEEKVSNVEEKVSPEYKLFLVGAGSLILILGLAIILGSKPKGFHLSKDGNKEKYELGSLDVEEPLVLFGLNENDINIKTDTIRDGNVLGEIMSKEGVSYDQTMQLIENGQKVYDIKKLRLGKPYHFIWTRDSSKHYFVYEPNELEYYICNLGDSLTIEHQFHPLDTISMTARGEIRSSLWDAIMQNNLAEKFAPQIVVKMEGAFGWTVDLLHLQIGDKYRMVYDLIYRDGELVAVGDLHAAQFRAEGKDYYAFHFGDDDKGGGFYNEKAEALKGFFLKAPIRASDVFRVSSRYNLRRRHPVLNRVKAHLGTDFAAPTGTPIVSTADGRIIQRGYTRGNGNYVKIKHDNTYTTQYLHMSRFNKSLKIGSRVKQGETIGYVGSTGLATGPHVCYRFWKNGKQVDPFKQNLPTPEPLPESKLGDFYKVRDYYMKEINDIPWNILNPETIEESVDTLEEPLS